LTIKLLIVKKCLVFPWLLTSPYNQSLPEPTSSSVCTFLIERVCQFSAPKSTRSCREAISLHWKFRQPMGWQRSAPFRKGNPPQKSPRKSGRTLFVVGNIPAPEFGLNWGSANERRMRMKMQIQFAKGGECSGVYYIEVQAGLGRHQWDLDQGPATQQLWNASKSNTHLFIFLYW